MKFMIKFVLPYCQLNKSEVKERLGIGALVKRENAKIKMLNIAKQTQIPAFSVQK